MSEPGSRRGRVHDAEGARQAILNAAETVFTEHGFDGARVDAIAAEAGYNKSLIFQYFGDKLGLYTEITRRADQEMSELQRRVFIPLLQEQTTAVDARTFKTLLETIVGIVFDYMREHPRFVRILLWEQAEGWETYKKIISQFDTDDFEHFEVIFRNAKEAGLLRSDFSPLIQLTLALQICLTYLAWIPLYQLVRPDEDLTSAEALASARAYIINFIVSGILVDAGKQTGET